MFAGQPAIDEHPGVARHAFRVASHANDQSRASASRTQISVRDEATFETVASALPPRETRSPPSERDDSTLVVGVPQGGPCRPMHKCRE